MHLITPELCNQQVLESVIVFQNLMPKRAILADFIQYSKPMNKKQSGEKSCPHTCSVLWLNALFWGNFCMHGTSTLALFRTTAESFSDMMWLFHHGCSLPTGGVLHDVKVIQHLLQADGGGVVVLCLLSLHRHLAGVWNVIIIIKSSMSVVSKSTEHLNCTAGGSSPTKKVFFLNYCTIKTFITQ